MTQTSYLSLCQMSLHPQPVRSFCWCLCTWSTLFPRDHHTCVAVNWYRFFSRHFNLYKEHKSKENKKYFPWLHFLIAFGPPIVLLLEVLQFASAETNSGYLCSLLVSKCLQTQGFVQGSCTLTKFTLNTESFNIEKSLILPQQ